MKYIERLAIGWTLICAILIVEIFTRPGNAVRKVPARDAGADVVVANSGSDDGPVSGD